MVVLLAAVSFLAFGLALSGLAPDEGKLCTVIGITTFAVALIVGVAQRWGRAAAPRGAGIGGALVRSESQKRR